MTKAEEYLTIHTLDPRFVKNELGWNWDNTKIRIPVYDIEGSLVYYKIRHLDYEARKAAEDTDAKKFTFDPPGNHSSLYCINKAKDESRIVLCEGEPDCARLWQDGIPAITATTGVGSLKKELLVP